VTTSLTVRANEQPVWLCFEPWASEYTVAPGGAVVVKFLDGPPVELTHYPEGITFLSFGRHPDIWGEDGEPVEIYSDSMPETPEGSMTALRFIMNAAPPPRH
jgi:hypothetical protein